MSENGETTHTATSTEQVSEGPSNLSYIQQCSELVSRYWIHQSGKATTILEIRELLLSSSAIRNGRSLEEALNMFIRMLNDIDNSRTRASDWGQQRHECFKQEEADRLDWGSHFEEEDETRKWGSRTNSTSEDEDELSSKCLKPLTPESFPGCRSAYQPLLLYLWISEKYTDNLTISLPIPKALSVTSCLPQDIHLSLQANGSTLSSGNMSTLGKSSTQPIQPSWIPRRHTSLTMKSSLPSQYLNPRVELKHLQIITSPSRCISRPWSTDSQIISWSLLSPSVNWMLWLWESNLPWIYLHMFQFFAGNGRQTIPKMPWEWSIEKMICWGDVSLLMLETYDCVINEVSPIMLGTKYYWNVQKTAD